MVFCRRDKISKMDKIKQQNFHRVCRYQWTFSRTMTSYSSRRKSKNRRKISKINSKRNSSKRNKSNPHHQKSPNPLLNTKASCTFTLPYFYKTTTESTTTGTLTTFPEDNLFKRFSTKAILSFSSWSSVKTCLDLRMNVLWRRVRYLGWRNDFFIWGELSFMDGLICGKSGFKWFLNIFFLFI